MVDLDQGGTFRQMQDVFMGPSVGWTTVPSVAILRVSATGTTLVSTGTTIVMVSVNANGVVIQLPLAKGTASGAVAIPGQFVASPLVIVDSGGFAGSHPITVNATGAETIDGLASLQLVSPFGAFVLQPDVINGGWTMLQ